MKNWNSIKNEFDSDGSLRDIYVYDASPSLWNELITKISNSKYKLEFTHGDQPLELPTTYAEIKLLQEDEPTTLFIWLADEIQANCHFFIDDEIEIDISPYDINSENDYLKVVDFLKWLSKSLTCNVALTHEGSPEMEILRVSK